MTATTNAGAATDDEGFLRDMADWSETVARQLAQQADIDLNPAQLELLRSARRYYERYAQAPLARAFVKHCQQDEPEFSSLHLMRLFPPSTSGGSSIKQICRLAGLPKPPGCL